MWIYYGKYARKYAKYALPTLLIITVGPAARRAPSRSESGGAPWPLGSRSPGPAQGKPHAVDPAETPAGPGPEPLPPRPR